MPQNVETSSRMPTQFRERPKPAPVKGPGRPVKKPKGAT